MSSQTTRPESVALVRIAAFQATLEPPYALRRAPDSEGVRHDIRLRPLLYPVVADGAGARQAFLDIALLQDLSRPVGALLKVSHLTRDPEQRLHMVTALVGDDIRPGEFAGCLKTIRQIPKERQIDENLLV